MWTVPVNATHTEEPTEVSLSGKGFSHTDLPPRRLLCLLAYLHPPQPPQSCAETAQAGHTAPSSSFPFVCLPTDNWGHEAEESPSTPEGRYSCYSAPNLENKKVAIDNHIQQENSCFSLENPFFFLLTLVHNTMIQCCGFASVCQVIHI